VARPSRRRGARPTPDRGIPAEEAVREARHRLERAEEDARPLRGATDLRAQKGMPLFNDQVQQVAERAVKDVFKTERSSRLHPKRQRRASR
jgi:hypothetical protein